MQTSRFHDFWQEHLEEFRDFLRGATDSTILLHVPKTGGTTVGHAIAGSPGWKSIWIGREPSGKFDAKPERRFKPKAGATRVLIRLTHYDYTDARDLQDFLLNEIGCLSEIIMPVRPAAERLQSAFRYYWTKVRQGLEVQKGAPASDWKAKITLGYLEDSRHYRKADGSVDAAAWFSAFEKYGPGVPFFFSDFFSSLDELHNAAENRNLTPVRVNEINQFLHGRGFEGFQRRNTSKPLDPIRTNKALASVRPEVDRIALRDKAFDDYFESLPPVGTVGI